MYLMTASLLNAWKWFLKTDNREDFLRTLRRIPSEKTEAMKKGDEFEAWAYEHIPEVMVGLHQFKAKKECGDYLLYGILDSLHAGIIYDLKYSGHYEVGKFYDSPQTSMYFELVEGAYKFVYIISNGSETYREEYRREEITPVMEIISQFEQWLRDNNLLEEYHTYWKAK